MKWLRYIAGGLMFAMIVIQFIPVDLPAVALDNPGDIQKGNLVTPDVAQLLKTSCYNCHSNETRYPWYSYVAPSSWLVAKDVREAREEINFSTWAEMDTGRMMNKLDDVATEVGEGHMPMPIYVIMHPSAKLDDNQRKRIVEWTEKAMDLLAEEEEEELEEGN